MTEPATERATDICFLKLELFRHRLSRLLNFVPILIFDFLDYLDFQLSLLSSHRPHQSFRAYENLFINSITVDSKRVLISLLLILGETNKTETIN